MPFAMAAVLGAAAGFASPPALAETPGAARPVAALDVRVTGARNDEGQIALLLFRTPAGYPDDAKRAFRSVLVPLHRRGAVVALPDLPPGRYVITLIHDENRNQKLDTSFFGIPKEGYGFSNNPKVGMSAPAFGACAFELGAGRAVIDVRLEYR